MLVASDEKARPDSSTGRAIGVSGWFVKPFRGEELVEAVREAVRAWLTLRA